jgi:integrase/recombinase XerD
VTDLAPTLQSFFTDHLIGNRHASTHTIAAYRDAWKLLLTFAHTRTGIPPSKLNLTDLDAPLITAFLAHLEQDRGNSVRTRNARLSAIHSLFGYAALRHPEHAAIIARVLAIPPKRFTQTLVTFLSDTEVDALLAAPDQTTWTGRRDHTMLAMSIETGLRVSELTALTHDNVHLGAGAHVSCLGKGRKQRITPLTSSTVTLLTSWLSERGGTAEDPVFCTRRGRPLSSDAVQRRLATHITTATSTCPSLTEKTISPHTLRHTAAMRLLAAGIDITVIALWLGHEDIASTRVYIHADMALKERALAATQPTTSQPGRYRPPDGILAFLEGL